MPPADDVRAAIRSIATRDGVSLDAVADSFRTLHGTTPDRIGLLAALAALRFTGEVWRRDDLYFWHEIGGPGEPVDTRRQQGRAVDFTIGSHSPYDRKLDEMISRFGVSRLIYPSPQAPDGPPVHISFAAGGLINAAPSPDPLADFRWEAPSDRVRTAESELAGAWTLIYLTERLPSRPDCGPGWYLYGPDLTAVPLGNHGVNAAQDLATTQVRAYIAVRQAAAHATGTGSAVPDRIRAAIHAGHIGQVCIFCDECGFTYEGAFTGETREDRFAAARHYLERHRGWLCGQQDLCPVCRTKTAS